MQQPLCHLYFFTLMEHLLTEPRRVNNLIRITGKISEVYVVTNYVLNCSCSFSRSQSHFLISSSSYITVKKFLLEIKLFYI